MKLFDNHSIILRNDENYNMTSTMSSLSASTSTSSSAAFRPLSETDLERQPEEVFDLVEEIGKGSYGTVHRAILKENNLEVAIKKVQVADELHEIIKEIAIMQQCESPFVVRYYGSYFANQRYDLSHVTSNTHFKFS
jgi:serine/threonine protein kinase